MENEMKKGVLVDKEAGERYNFVVKSGERIFQNSALTDTERDITADDVLLISEFHRYISPVNPSNSWRETASDKSIERGEIADPSTFSNWEAPGEPLEHIALAAESARIITSILKDHLKEESNDDWVRQVALEVNKVDPNHAACAAALHDEGREVTHLFYTNEVIGRRLLQRIGIREDIADILPDESVMQTSQEEDMNQVIRNLSPEAVIVRIADEFGKRAPGKNRLYNLGDYDEKNQDAWGKRYVSKPESGRPSDKWMRKHIVLHNANAGRYFEAIDNWVGALTDLTLEDISRELNRRLDSSLPPLRERVVLTTGDILEGQVLSKELELGGNQVRIEAFTEIGGPKKKFNEDGCTIIKKDGSIIAIVVDGGTQVEPLPNLGELSGGKYISDAVSRLSSDLCVDDSMDNVLRELNRKVGLDMIEKNLGVTYGEFSRNVPYGSIAGVKIDIEKGEVQIANAGDVFVVSIGKDGSIQLLTKDDVYEYDQNTYMIAKELADKYGLTPRFVMENRDKDEKFRPVIDDGMLNTMHAQNIGQIKRITGNPEFEITGKQQIDLKALDSILIFSDGAVPVGVDIHNQEDLNQFVDIIKTSGLERLYEEIKKAAADDPDFQNPRFRDIDDTSIVRISFK